MKLMRLKLKRTVLALAVSSALAFTPFGTANAVDVNTYNTSDIGGGSPLLGNTAAADPATCTVGQLYFKTTAAAGGNIYGCTAPNTWTTQGTAGSGTVTSVGWTGGLVTIATATTTPAFTVAGTSGGIPYFSGAATWASSAALAQYGVVLGGGAGATPYTITKGGVGQVLLGAATNPTFTTTPVFGNAGAAAGSLGLSGSGSGVVTIQTAAAAGTWSLTLPTTGGTVDYVLRTDGAGVTSWVAQSAGGALTAGTTAITSGANYSVLVEDSAGKFNVVSGLTWSGAAAGTGLALPAGTATTAVSPLSITQTWNNGAVVFPGIVFNATQTAKAATSLYLDFQSTGTPVVSIGLDGSIIWHSTSSPISLVPLSNQNMAVNVGATPVWGFSGSDTQFRVLNSGSIGFTTGVWGAANRTAISEVASGVIGIGTGTAGSFAGRLKSTSTITAAVAVGSLNASPTIGEVQTVNDALAVAAKGATVAAGGSAVCQVMWNGSNWVGI